MIQTLYLQGFQEDPPVQEIFWETGKRQNIRLLVKREDLIHPRLSGNKWRKLKYNLLSVQEKQKEGLITFGGAFSNHIAAVAEAGDLFNYKTIGIIRGEATHPLNPTLDRAQSLGMQLIFVTRSQYRDKITLLEDLDLDQETMLVIPEGGTNTLALQGCREIIEGCSKKEAIDYWCVACGTGGTAAGMIQALEGSQQLIGFSVLKGDFLKARIQELLGKEEMSSPAWNINNDYHFGGYAKFDPVLIQFINDFKNQHGIQLDPIYTGKLFYGVFDLISKGFFEKGSTLMLVHTGGQQGIAGFNQRFGGIIL